ncbi:MAG TPA: hypothetical protein VMS93_10245, partial [Candidatus Saccharimonadales bacterium]|nr:hypothetical protein [Candidatus Saccharimonadales bacterium]
MRPRPASPAAAPPRLSPWIEFLPDSRRAHRPRRFLLAAAGVAALLTAALGGEARATNVSGNVSGTWTPGGGPYVVVGNATVPASQTLTIQAGTTVLIDPGLYLQVSGTLITQGTAGQPVLITCNSVTGQKFESLLLTNGCTVTMSYTSVNSGGTGGFYCVDMNGGGAVTSFTWSGGSCDSSGAGGIRATTTSVSLTNLTIHKCAGDGINLTPSAPPFLDQVHCDSLSGRAIVINQNPGSFPATLSSVACGLNGIYLTGTLGGGAPAGQFTWANNPGFPYVVNTVGVPANDSLAIAAGTVVKFWNSAAYLQINGAR